MADAAPFGGVSGGSSGRFPAGWPAVGAAALLSKLLSALLSDSFGVHWQTGEHSLPPELTSVIPGRYRGAYFGPCARIARAAGRPKAGRCRPTFPGRASTRDARAAPWTTCNMACNIDAACKKIELVRLLAYYKQMYHAVIWHHGMG